jgi:hypothetical protein
MRLSNKTIRLMMFYDLPLRAKVKHYFDGDLLDLFRASHAAFLRRLVVRSIKEIAFTLTSDAVSIRFGDSSRSVMVVSAYSVS